jgi:hypothetical protein
VSLITKTKLGLSEARNIEKAIYKSQKNVNSIETAKSKTLEPPDMPKGKTDLADQEETKTISLEAIPNRKVIIAANLRKKRKSS